MGNVEIYLFSNEVMLIPVKLNEAMSVLKISIKFELYN